MSMTASPCVTNPSSNKIFGKLVGDKGYICKDLFSKLFVDGIQLVTKLKSNMKGQIMTISDRVLLRKRALIESVSKTAPFTHQLLISTLSVSKTAPYTYRVKEMQVTKQPRTKS